jgi:hypothetical protein
MVKKRKETGKIFAGDFAELLADFAILSDEVRELKQQNRKLMEKLFEVEKKQTKTSINPADVDYIINKAVKATIKKTQNRNFRNDFMKKFERRKKEFIKQKILELAETKHYTIPEIKEIVVDKEGYCSKASFYRYIEKLRWKKQIDFLEIDERRIVTANLLKSI